MRRRRHRLIGVLVAAGCGSPPTYPEVAPVVQAHCIACHRDDGMAPMSLQRFEDARAYAAKIAREVDARRMPPLPADPACRPLDDVRVLGDADRALLVRWAREGAEEGEPIAPLAPPPDPLGPPTDEYDSGLDYTPAVEDEYRCFVVDPGFDDLTEAVAVDVSSTNPRIVHHAAVFSSAPQTAADVDSLDAADPLPGWACFGGPGFVGAIRVGQGTPGASARPFPEGTGVRFPAGTRFVVQMHYDTLEADGANRFTVRMWRPSAPLRGVPSFEFVGTDDIEIPAGEEVEVTARTTVVGPGETPEPLVEMEESRAFLVGGHMHLLGESVRADVVRADGARECLLDVPDWDFHWQGAYWLADPVELRAGDALEIRCRWDNTAGNQPEKGGVRSEPVDVSWGLGTRDEMCLGWVVTTPL